MYATGQNDVLMCALELLCWNTDCYNQFHITNQQLLLEVIFLKHTLLVGWSKIT